MSALTLSHQEYILSNSTMLLPNPATPPKNGASPWSTLPKEISDQILRLAYGTPDKPLSMLDKDEFACMQRREEEECEDDEESEFKPRAYSRYIDRLLISKQFLHESLEALFTSTPILIPPESPTFFNLHPLVVASSLRSKSYPLPPPNLGLQFLTNVHITSLSASMTFAPLLSALCPRLRQLHISEKFPSCSLHSLTATWPGETYVRAEKGLWKPEDVRGSEWMGAMGVFGGLESVSLVVKAEESIIPLFATKPETLEIVRANVKLAGEAFVESATRPREQMAAGVCEGGSVRGPRLRVPKIRN